MFWLNAVQRADIVMKIIESKCDFRCPILSIINPAGISKTTIPNPRIANTKPAMAMDPPKSLAKSGTKDRTDP